MAWEIYLTNEVEAWLDRLMIIDPDSHLQVVSAVEALGMAVPTWAVRWWIGSRVPLYTT